MEFTDVYYKNIEAMAVNDLIINQGGARAGKTYAILQVLLNILLYNNSKKKLVISVVSQSIPHLKKGAIRDFKNICANSNIDFKSNFNFTDMEFKYNAHLIEFFSADNTGKVRGPARDILFINEADKIKYEVYEHLEIRTKSKIFIDFNPETKFWVHTEIIDKQLEHAFIHTTYKDNRFLAQRIVEAIERKKGNENWWRVFGLGLIGFSEKIIFNESKLKRFDKLPDEKTAFNISYTDVAYGGGDFFATVFGKVANGEIYIFDVIFNNNSIDVNENILTEKIKNYNVKYFCIETNGGGQMLALRLKKLKEYGKVIPVNNNTSKIARIITQATIILDNFYFKKEIDGEYYTYINQLTSFNNDEHKNKYDDAPDATAGLAYFATTGLKMFLDYYN